LDAKAKGPDMLFEVLQREKWRNRPLEITLYGQGPQEES